MGLGKRAAQAILVVVLVACSDQKGTVNVGDLEGGVVYPDQTFTDGGFSSDAGASKVGPLVTVTSPPPSGDPVVGPVLSGPSVDVKCTVVQRDKTGPVDPTKVAIWVYAAGVIDPVLKVPAVLQATDTFGASVALDLVPTGAVRFRCLAADTAAISQTGFGDVTTFYDAGPKITFTNLNADSIIKFGTDTANDLSVQFKVEPSRLSALDTEADIANVKLSVSGRETTFPLSADGSYEQSYDFNDLFAGIAVDSVTIVVSATNKRSKAQVTSKKQLLIRIDSEGPSVTFTSPARPNNAAPIVGGTVIMVMTITDALSGVADGSDKVYAKIDQRIYPLTKGTNNVYTFTFEAADFKNTANITAQIYAFDKAGNTRKEVPNFSMHLDTVPPWVSLDPLPVRECNKMTGECSKRFDPLGRTPSDGQIVPKEALFRALVWERGIRVEGQNTIWIAGVRDETVTFYAQPNPNVPLIVDTNGDKECDSVNNASTLGDLAPFVQSLNAVAPSSGVPLESTTAEELMLDPRVIGAVPFMNTMPTPRCNLSEMTYVISHTVSPSTPVVYAMNTAEVCTGQSIDPGMKGGWTCIAASARDGAGSQGNLGISKPLRVCRAVSSTDCVGENALPPATLTCTDGCTIPADWTKEPTSRVYEF
jgi:hypothetical protein